ncbi:universal stress protein [Actinomycetaceae bacterium MB13-C1-2]|nr:universal stress protein [Actinomycetaceae bacterium MB13-C1-2]
MHNPPQPSLDRLTPFAGNAIVVGVVPNQPDLVVATAISFARASGSNGIYFAYADPSRYVHEELLDGSVRHVALNPDSLDQDWQERSAAIEARLEQSMDGTNIPWQFRYLAGRPDRALTHLARAVNAAVIVVGSRAEGRTQAIREFFEGSVAVHLAQHQHRPVLTVPLSVVDWKDAASKWEK